MLLADLYNGATHGRQMVGLPVREEDNRQGAKSAKDAKKRKN
jgi:hypothetical protein